MSNHESNNVTPRFIFAEYAGCGIFGFAKNLIKNSAYYARVTVYAPENRTVIISVPVQENGSFSAWFSCDAEHVTVALTDKPDAPAGYPVFDALELDVQ